MTAQTHHRAVELRQVMEEMPYGMYIVGSVRSQGSPASRSFVRGATRRC